MTHESDHDGDFFAHFGSMDSYDNSDVESYQDDYDESDHDIDLPHSRAEDSDHNCNSPRLIKMLIMSSYASS